MRAIIDTTILIDFLRGVEAARRELDRYDDPEISMVTWMEVLVGAKDTEEEVELRSFLRRFDVQPISLAVAEEAIRVRRSHRLRLPDAIVWGTARTLNCLLVSRNTKDFPADDPGVRVPYQI